MDTLPDVRRLITSRGVWVAVLAAVVAVGIALFVRSRRPVPAAPEATPVPAEQLYPPEPVLGVPAAEDLRRYAAEPAPDPVVRRRLVRWGSVAVALAVLAAGTYWMESEVFHGSRAEVAWGKAHSYGTPMASPTDELRVEETPPTTPPTTLPTTPPTTPDADCRPWRGEPQVRRPAPRVTRAVNRQWRRIEKWLRANAPKSHRALAKPARARTIALAETQMGTRFPDDLKASLLRHNGGLAVLGHWAHGVRSIRDTWRMLCGIDSVDVDGDARGDWWDGRMIPFAADGSGNYLVVDSVQRDIGNSDHEGSMDFTFGDVPIRSYYALLKMTADALESGDPIAYWKPVVINGVLDWEIL